MSGERAHSSRECAPLVHATRLPQVTLAQSHFLPLPLHYAIRDDRRVATPCLLINNTSRVHRTTAPPLVDVSIQLSNSRLRKAHTDMHNIYSLLSVFYYLPYL